MKKNIIKATLVAAFALIAGYNVYSSQRVEGMSDLALANVEALAYDDEATATCPWPSSSYGNCRELKMDYNQIRPHAYCGICDNPRSNCTYSLEAEANRYL